MGTIETSPIIYQFFLDFYPPLLNWVIFDDIGTEAGEEAISLINLLPTSSQPFRRVAVKCHSNGGRVCLIAGGGVLWTEMLVLSGGIILA